MSAPRDFYRFLTLIPSGKVTSYLFLSRVFDSHPRAIARYLATNEEPDRYPCYKVLAHSGALSGYGGGVPEKIRRLKADGIVIRDGKVDRSFFWEPSTEEVRALFKKMKEGKN